MLPTRKLVLLWVAALLGATTYLLCRLGYDRLPAVPTYAPVSLALLALATLYLSLAVRDRRSRRVRVEPLLVARYVALSKAGSLLGAGFVGAYGGLLAYVAGRLGSPTPRHDAVVAAVGLICSAALTLGALRLEAACRIPPRDDDADLTD